jgi:electron transfer flavoprotein alpha subunit
VADVLIIAEHDGHVLSANTAKCVSCAVQIAPGAVDVAVLAAPPGGEIAAAAADLEGVRRVLNVTHATSAAMLAATLAPQAAALARDYSHVLGPSSTFGKDLMPRAAALLGVGQLSDVMAVEGPYLFKRPIYAGNAIITVEAAPDDILVATVRTASYAACDGGGSAPVEERRLDVELPAHTRFVALESAHGDLPDLQTAARVVAGGRGLGSKKQFELIERLAAALGAAIGASRAAVDSGFVANDLQVGQTGKIIAPELYVAVGISGAIQHLTGIKDAGTIVAVNKDADAPIFDVADFGLVADLFEAVPELIDEIRSL